MTKKNYNKILQTNLNFLKQAFEGIKTSHWNRKLKTDKGNGQKIKQKVDEPRTIKYNKTIKSYQIVFNEE